MNIKNKTIDYEISKTIIFFGIIGAICGSFVSFKIDNQNLKKYFGIFLILIAILEICTFFKKYRLYKNENNK